ncbi:right-handed parallel beta-helix repeat-containing protein [candidate division KSB1 bacterium]|nr:right-handed parallel beta-helix repeat-containing protein [candidate division KSB1 bacterium]
MADGKLLRGEKWCKFVYDGMADFYVSPVGNDTWSGMLDSPNADRTDGPFATLGRAQKAVRELKQKVYTPKTTPVETRYIGSPHEFGRGKDILVLLREGYYTLEAPLIFGPEDGGERIETSLPSGAFEYHKLRDHYVTYAAYPGERPVLSGGRLIDSWNNTGEIWTTTVDLDHIDMLVANGSKQILARAPNSGGFTPERLSESDLELHFRENDLKTWPDMEDNRVILLLRWHTGVNSIVRIDAEENIAYFAKPEPGILIVPPRYYIENIKSLLDTAGEWFFDRHRNELSYWPPAEVADPNEARMIAPHLQQLIIVCGRSDRPVRNLRFYDLHFEAIRGHDKALSLEYAHAAELVNSRVQSCCGTAVYVGKGCYQTRILHNTFEQVDRSVILIDGQAHPENWTDIIRETVVSHNSIKDCGGTNIEAHNALYTTISHNEISHTRGRHAISVGGWRNQEEAIDGGYRVEYNHLHQVQRDADDSGAIKTAGLTTDSYVRGNLIHDVHAGYFNDNVGFWFDNMSSGWIVTENIYYNLAQGEMKLCAANLVDNVYENNFVIETPTNPPESHIDGEPRFEYSDLEIVVAEEKVHEIRSGGFLTAKAMVSNCGATGIVPVPLYIDGKIAETKPLPVIHNNGRRIEFGIRLYEPGEHQMAIGETPYRSIRIVGEKVKVDFNDLDLSHSIVPDGEKVILSAIAHNLTDQSQTIDAPLALNGAMVDKKTLTLAPQQATKVTFEITATTGLFTVQIGNSPQRILNVFAHKPCAREMSTYCSGRAEPHRIDLDEDASRIRIQVSGSDFFHAEDSYAAAYIAKVKGNFIATIKVTGFAERTNPWFRAGLFARNDMTLSFDIEPGSKGSVLCFTTPGRAGLQWDEFGDGCMHKANSENLPEDVRFPIWLKLIRRGDSFSAAISYDGVTWVREKKTGSVPGLAAEMDVGLAAGSCDQASYWVEFEDFELRVEE